MYSISSSSHLLLCCNSPCIEQEQRVSTSSIPCLVFCNYVVLSREWFFFILFVERVIKWDGPHFLSHFILFRSHDDRFLVSFSWYVSRRKKKVIIFFLDGLWWRSSPITSFPKKNSSLNVTWEGDQVLFLVWKTSQKNPKYMQKSNLQRDSWQHVSHISKFIKEITHPCLWLYILRRIESSRSTIGHWWDMIWRRHKHFMTIYTFYEKRNASQLF
jgi:hypothetical protein